MTTGSVDAVLATVILYSLRSPERAVAEVFRVLRPGVTGPHLAGHGVR